MIDNINEKLRQAQIAKDKDDMVKHAERTRQIAINLMKVDKVSETPEIKANGHKVKFLDPDNLKMVVDGKVFIGKEEIDSEINRIDFNRSRYEKSKEIKMDKKDLLPKDGRQVGDYKTRYPECKSKIIRDAIYIVVLMTIALVVIFLNFLEVFRKKANFC